MNHSQQLKRGRVAPFNPDPRWPTGYFHVLEELGVEEPRHPFYVHWVRQFFNRQKKRKRRRDLGREEIEAFIQALAAEPGVADWQVVQARDALEAYYEQFRGIALEPAQTMAAQAERGPYITKPADGIPAPRILDRPASIPKPQRQEPARKVDLAALEKATRVALRTEHYAMKTEQSYLHWMRRFVSYHHGKRPSHMGGAEIHQFLSHLAINERVAASTQNQALNAIVFLYRKVVKKVKKSTTH